MSQQEHKAAGRDKDTISMTQGGVKVEVELLTTENWGTWSNIMKTMLTELSMQFVFDPEVEQPEGATAPFLASAEKLLLTTMSKDVKTNIDF